MCSCDERKDSENMKKDETLCVCVCVCVCARGTPENVFVLSNG